MCTLYERIMTLCQEKGVSGSRMCLDLGLSKSTLSDMKSGRKKGLSTSNAQKIANYLGVSVDYLLGVESSEWCERFRGQLAKVLETTNREDMAAACIDIGNLWRIAEGEASLSFDKACEIADMLGVSVDYLLGKEEQKNNAPDELVLTEDEIRILSAFREMSPERQKALADLLGISDPQK